MMFEAKRVIDKRVRNGQIEYQIEWKDFPDVEDFTWQSIHSLQEDPEATRLVEEFEKDPNKSIPEPKEAIGFDSGHEPSHIIAALEEDEKLMFLMKWKEFDSATLVEAKEANVKCPQIVIEFYESRLLWSTNCSKN